MLAHSDIASDPKRDPAEHFPWDALAAAGVGLSVGPEHVLAHAPSEADERALHALQTSLSRVGYRCPLSGALDQPTREAVAAFQRRWRPTKVDGVPDRSTLSALAAVAVARRLPSDDRHD